ncbi:hypothetical protein [Brevibacillus parabrevis]|uniref:hypothetical protein n=1 Tax=Brevibacillus parabrevis TaxID=54914 RepID=UPI0012F47902|nr:hypothetical protein [Brevibacillus parabrevis]
MFAQHFTQKQLYGGGADFIIKKINVKAQKNHSSKRKQTKTTKEGLLPKRQQQLAWQAWSSSRRKVPGEEAK